MFMLQLLAKLHNAERGVRNKTARQCTSIILIYFEFFIIIICRNNVNQADRF